MLPNTKQFPYFVEETIVACLSHLKKKRPKVSSLLLTIHQVLYGQAEHEEKSKKSSLNSSANFGKSFLRWNCESPYTMDTFVKQQYTALKFAEPIPPTNSYLLLPGLSSYRGAIKDKVPNGEGDLIITDVLGYTGNFYEGFIHGNGKVNMFRRQETLIGKFWKGFPIEGTISNAAVSLKIWFEDVSWIPTKDYRTKMIEGFKNLDQKFSRNLRTLDPKMLDDSRNRNLIKSYVDFVSRSGICGTTKAQLVDCFGNFYYSPGGFVPQVAPSSLVIKKIGPIELSMKVYKAKISMETMLGVEFSALDLSLLDEKSTNPLKSCSQGNFEQVSRYFHFGCKYYGHMQANKLNRGIVYMNYNDYFWYDGSGKMYSGAKYTRQNKCLYIGDIFSSKAEGFGMEYIEAEKRYEGEYKDGRPHGRGITYNEFGRLEFRGIFSDGKPLYGFYYERNSVYEGKFRQIFSHNVEYIMDQEPSRELKNDLDRLEIITSENLKPSFMERMNIQPETCRRRPVFESISPTESDSDSLMDEPEDYKIRKTEFEGNVQNFSENIRELRGKFIIEDRRFNGKFYIQYVDGSIYDGELKNGIREGYGIYKKPNGTEFEGVWRAGVLKGKIEWGKGSNKMDYSEGEFSKEKTGGTRQNGFGRIKFKNGDYYEGETKDGIMNGFGKLRESSGRVYEGNMRNGRKDGVGKLWEHAGETGTYYEGEFKEGQREGFGVVYKNGCEVFRGKFVRDKPKVGRLTRYASKSQGYDDINKEEKELFYFGEVALDKHLRIVAKGWGKLVLENKVIKGVFDADSLRDSIGLIMYGRPEEAKQGNEGVAYFGEIDRNIENGLGMKDYKKGASDSEAEICEGKDIMERYEGQWIDGERKGLARAWYIDKVEGQKLYRGEYYSQKEGLGELQMQEDVYYRGEFREGERDGRGTLYKKGKKIRGLYKKGSIQRMIYES